MENKCLYSHRSNTRLQGAFLTERVEGFLELEDGTRFFGHLFGTCSNSDGEVVFNTGMVGYPESMTDPSYCGQILALTYPLVGSYGISSPEEGRFESDKIQIRGLVVSEIIREHSHYSSQISLAHWMSENGITGISAIDTRELTKILRSRGTMLGRIMPAKERTPFDVEDPNCKDLVRQVTTPEVKELGKENEGASVLLIDCGCKGGIVRELLLRGCKITVIPYDLNYSTKSFDGVIVSNGPGDPAILNKTISHLRAFLDSEKPVAGICLGCQIIALAAEGRTYKLKFGHRSQNQPCKDLFTGHCVITSQNHGYAVDADSLSDEWSVWYRNLNDGTVEGIRHRKKPFFALQFHPEACPGPTDSKRFFDMFVEEISLGY